MNRINANSESVESPRISLAGCLLVASPTLSRSVFEQSVCLVLEHTRERAVGIMLNKPLQLSTDVLFSQVAPELTSSGNRKKLFFGGPESGPILAVHDNAEFAEGGNQLGIYLSAQVDHLKELASLDTQRLRLYAGSSLWKAGELDQQVVLGAWHVLPAIPELVFDDEAGMWFNAIRSIGNQVYAEAIGIDLKGYDCTLN